MKIHHDPTRIMPPKAKVAVVAATVAIVAAGATAPAATTAMKMRHDCCVWTAPTK